MNMMNRYKVAGYTHYISWEIFNKNLSLNVKKGFPTTVDAVKMHLNTLKKNKNVLNLKVETI